MNEWSSTLCPLFLCEVHHVIGVRLRVVICGKFSVRYEVRSELWTGSRANQTTNNSNTRA